MTNLEFYKTWCLTRLDYECLRTLELEKGHKNYDEIRSGLINDTNDMKKQLLKDFEKGSLTKLKRWFSACNEEPPTLMTQTIQFLMHASLLPAEKESMISIRSGGRGLQRLRNVANCDRTASSISSKSI